MANFNFSNHPVIERLRQNQDVAPNDLLTLQQSITSAVTNNEITRQQRAELRSIIQNWLGARQNAEIATRNSLDVMRRSLERGWGEATVDTFVDGAQTLGTGLATGSRTAIDRSSAFLSENLGEGNSTLKKAGVLALAATGGALIVGGARWLWQKIRNAPKRALAAILGLGVLASGVAGLTPWARARENDTAGGNEQDRLNALQAETGTIATDRIENLNLLASQLRGRMVTLAPGLEVGFVDVASGTASTTNIQVGTRMFSLTADGTLGDLSSRFRNEPTTLRLNGNEATLNVNNGAEVRYINRADLVAALTRVNGSPAGSAAVTVDVPTRRQPRGLGTPEAVRLTFTPRI